MESEEEGDRIKQARRNGRWKIAKRTRHKTREKGHSVDGSWWSGVGGVPKFQQGLRQGKFKYLSSLRMTLIQMPLFMYLPSHTIELLCFYYFSCVGMPRSQPTWPRFSSHC